MFRNILMRTKMSKFNKKRRFTKLQTRINRRVKKDMLFSLGKNPNSKRENEEENPKKYKRSSSYIDGGRKISFIMSLKRAISTDKKNKYGQRIIEEDEEKVEAQKKIELKLRERKMQRSLFVDKRRSNEIKRYVSGHRIERISKKQCVKQQKKIVIDTYTIGPELSCQGIRKLNPIRDTKQRAKTAPRGRSRAFVNSPKRKLKINKGQTSQGYWPKNKEKEGSSHLGSILKEKNRNKKDRKIWVEKSPKKSLGSLAYRTLQKQSTSHNCSPNHSPSRKYQRSKFNNRQNVTMGSGFFFKTKKPK